jgi:hypothetical protein
LQTGNTIGPTRAHALPAGGGKCRKPFHGKAIVDGHGEAFSRGTPIASGRKSDGSSQGVFTNGEENG